MGMIHVEKSNHEKSGEHEGWQLTFGVVKKIYTTTNRNAAAILSPTEWPKVPPSDLTMMESSFVPAAAISELSTVLLRRVFEVDAGDLLVVVLFFSRGDFDGLLGDLDATLVTRWGVALLPLLTGDLDVPFLGGIYTSYTRGKMKEFFAKNNKRDMHYLRKCWWSILTEESRFEWYEWSIIGPKIWIYSLMQSCRTLLMMT